MRGTQERDGEEGLTNHLARLYSAAGAIIVFFLLWATIAAHPWATTVQVTPQDPRLVALAHREKRLQTRAAAVKGIVGRRWAVYEQRLSRRERQNAVALQRHLSATRGVAGGGGSRCPACRGPDRAGPRVRGERRHLGESTTSAGAPRHKPWRAPPTPPAAETAAPLRITAPSLGTASPPQRRLRRLLPLRRSSRRQGRQLRHLRPPPASAPAPAPAPRARACSQRQRPRPPLRRRPYRS